MFMFILRGVHYLISLAHGVESWAGAPVSNILAYSSSVQESTRNSDARSALTSFLAKSCELSKSIEHSHCVVLHCVVVYLTWIYENLLLLKAQNINDCRIKCNVAKDEITMNSLCHSTPMQNIQICLSVSEMKQ